MKTNSTIYAALDLHCERSVLGSMNHEALWLGCSRFPTTAQALKAAVAKLGDGANVHLTLEASSLTRWAVTLLRPLVAKVIICEPRFNKLIASNPNKNDERDVEDLCLLLRFDKLKEVWMGDDRARQLHRELVYELLNWRDAVRELKALIKARYRQWGVLQFNGTAVFSRVQREKYLSQLPGPQEVRILSRIYAQHDHALEQWKETLRDVRQVGRAFWEITEFQKLPGIAVIGANVFSAIIEEPARFATRQRLIKYACLSITDRTSDGKPLGYQRLDRRGNRELKTLSYHAWRTACKSTTGDNPIQRFYRASLERTHDVPHARLNTQRKILEAMWLLWLRREHFDPQRFFTTTDPPAKAPGQSTHASTGG
jgi:transposase